MRVDGQTTQADVAVAQPPAFQPGTDGAVSVEDAKPIGPKKRASKPKPCQRCEERRARERQYAKTSRLRARASRSTAADGSDVASSEAASSSSEGQVAPTPA